MHGKGLVENALQAALYQGGESNSMLLVRKGKIYI